jgi:hypothetical protein
MSQSLYDVSNRVYVSLFQVWTAYVDQMQFVHACLLQHIHHDL